jgi:vacuolar-type H+-ATPase subunit H
MSEVVKKRFEQAQNRVKQKQQELLNELEKKIEDIRKRTIEELRKVVG